MFCNEKLWWEGGWVKDKHVQCLLHTKERKGATSIYNENINLKMKNEKRTKSSETETMEEPLIIPSHPPILAEKKEKKIKYPEQA
jgi:hypothetical protein